MIGTIFLWLVMTRLGIEAIAVIYLAWIVYKELENDHPDN